MKAITIKQPWASLICAGIKDIENRTWPTKFRGRVLVHCSASKPKMNYYDFEPFKTYWTEAGSNCGISQSEMKEAMKTKFNFIHGVIIGSVDIVDCVINHQSIWAEKGTAFAGYDKLGWAKRKPIYNWVLANPILFPEPIPAKGKLSFWDYPAILSEPEETGGELFCHCQLPVIDEKQVMRLPDEFRCQYCGGKWYK